MPVVTPEIIKQVARLARLRLEGEALAQLAAPLQKYQVLRKAAEVPGTS